MAIHIKFIHSDMMTIFRIYFLSI